VYRNTRISLSSIAGLSFGIHVQLTTTRQSYA
jgi:hypothetical protein